MTKKKKQKKEIQCLGMYKGEHNYKEPEGIRDIMTSVVQDFTKSLNDKLEFITREYSVPPIKGDLTKGKCKHRGIRMCQQNVSWDKVVYWIEQRGKQIGPKIEFNGFKL